MMQKEWGRTEYIFFGELISDSEGIMQVYPWAMSIKSMEREN